MRTPAAAVVGIPITDLPEATLPLAGTEPILCVQDGVTSQVPASAFGGTAGAAVLWTGIATAALPAGVSNDVVVDVTQASRLDLTLAGAAQLNGLNAGTDGQMLSIQNLSTVDDLTIEPEAAGSTAAQRFAINGTLIVPARCAALFMYNGTVARWVKQ